MAVYTVIAHQRLDDYAVVQTLTDTPVEPGQSVTLAGLGHGLNGTHTVLFCPQNAYIGTDAATGEWLYNPADQRANQILFYDPGDALDWSTAVPTGTLTWTQTCTWINASAISTYLDIPLTSANAATLLTQCASAANAFAYRRRVEAGYLEDSLTTSPGGDVTLGTIMIGAAYFRQQGSYTALASFDGMGTPPANGITPMVLQLLGINRPQVA
jgi:hypothetical protein